MGFIWKALLELVVVCSSFWVTAGEYEVSIYERVGLPGSGIDRMRPVAEGKLLIRPGRVRMEGCRDCLGEVALLSLRQPDQTDLIAVTDDLAEEYSALHISDSESGFLSNIRGLARVRVTRPRRSCTIDESSSAARKSGSGSLALTDQAMLGVLGVNYTKRLHFARRLFRSTYMSTEGYEFFSVEDGSLTGEGGTFNQKGDFGYCVEPGNSNRFDLYHLIRGLINYGEDYPLPNGADLHDDLFQVIYGCDIGIDLTENRPSRCEVCVDIVDRESNRGFVLVVRGQPGGAGSVSDEPTLGVALNPAAAQLLSREFAEPTNEQQFRPSLVSAPVFARKRGLHKICSASTESDDIIPAAVFGTEGAYDSPLPGTEPDEAVYNSLLPGTEPDEAVYNSPLPGTEPDEAVYNSLLPGTEPDEAVYNSPLPGTEPDEAVYNSLLPGAGRGGVVYNSPLPGTEPDEAVYDSLLPGAGRGGVVYNSPLPGTEPDEAVYDSLLLGVGRDGVVYDSLLSPVEPGRDIYELVPPTIFSVEKSRDVTFPSTPLGEEMHGGEVPPRVSLYDGVYNTVPQTDFAAEGIYSTPQTVLSGEDNSYDVVRSVDEIYQDIDALSPNIPSANEESFDSIYSNCIATLSRETAL